MSGDGRFIWRLEGLSLDVGAGAIFFCLGCFRRIALGFRDIRQ